MHLQQRDKNLVRQLFWLMQASLALLWPVTALAAQIAFTSTLVTPDMLLDLVLTAGIGVLVGFSSLLTLMKREYEAKGSIDRLWLFVSSKMSASLVAALAMYFGAQWLGLSRSATVGAIILASFTGGPFLEQAGAWFVNRLFPKAST